jgi:hypothetical protein
VTKFSDNFQTAYSSHQDEFGADVTVRDSGGESVGSTIQGSWGTINHTMNSEEGERIVKTRTLTLSKADLASINPGYQFSPDGGTTWWDIDRDADAELLEETAGGLWILNLVHQADGERASPDIRRTR